VVVALERPPHPAQIIAAAKKKDVKIGFMFGPSEPIRAGACFEV
jgi:pentose-5-phosphate-3-epimerase